MFPKFFFYMNLMLFSLALTCVHGAIFASTSFTLMKKDTRAVNGIISGFPGASLLKCAVLCSRSSSCNAFQHSRSSSGDSGGTCELLNADITSGVLETEDQSCNIYNANVMNFSTSGIATSDIPTTTKATPTPLPVSETLATTTALPDDKNPALICASNSSVKPVKANCTCSTPDDYCSGILQCTGIIAGKSFKYYLDQTSSAIGMDNARKMCSDLYMDLITVKSLQEQLTICSILSQAVGTQLKRAFYMGLSRNKPVSDDSEESDSDAPTETWYFDDTTKLGSFSSWAGDTGNGSCATLIGYNNNRFNWKKDLCNDYSSEVDYYGICSYTENDSDD